MGNRAVITTKGRGTSRVGVYLHWNGGRDSVSAFLLYCKLKGYRTPDQDNYGWARLCQVIGNYFGGECSVGIDQIKFLDCNNYDNGMYLIENWEIVGRKYYRGREQDSHDLLEMLEDINNRQPVSEQINIIEEMERVCPNILAEYRAKASVGV